MNKKEVASELNLTAIRNIPEINPGDDLSQIINGCLTDQSISLKDKDVLIIAQKIISKSEDRFIDLKTVDPSEKAIEVSKKTDKDPRLVELILQESCEIIRAEKGILVVEHKLGHILANAGIDRSNTARPDNEVLLLPIDPDKSARKIKQYFEDLYQIKIGVLITDSIGRAWRPPCSAYAICNQNPNLNLIQIFEILFDLSCRFIRINRQQKHFIVWSCSIGSINPGICEDVPQFMLNN